MNFLNTPSHADNETFIEVAGDYAIYRMADPERLTIEIIVTQWDRCIIKEVRGKGNKLPSPAVIKVVE